MLLRRVVPQTDSKQVVALIDSVYREYGDRVHLAGADADLTRLTEAYLHETGDFVVLLNAAADIVGCHAILGLGGPWCTFRRLYLHRSVRGKGHGRRLMDWAEEEARRRGFRHVAFWSDRRFTHAHAFFARLGYQHDGRVRCMDDGAIPYEELFFSRDL